MPAHGPPRRSREDSSAQREDHQPNERDFYDWRRAPEPPVVVPATRNSSSRSLRPPAPPPSLPSAPRSHRPVAGPSRSRPPVPTEPRPERDVPDLRPPRPSHPRAALDDAPPRRRGEKAERCDTIQVRGFKRHAPTVPGFREDVVDLFSQCGPIRDLLVDEPVGDHVTVFIRFESTRSATEARSLHGRPGPGAARLYVSIARKDHPWMRRPDRSPDRPPSRPPSRPRSPPRSTDRVFSPQSSPLRPLPQRARPPPTTVGSWSDSRPARAAQTIPQQGTSSSAIPSASALPRSPSHTLRPSSPCRPAQPSDRPPPELLPEQREAAHVDIEQPPASSQVTDDGEILEDSHEVQVELPQDCIGQTKEAVRKKQAFRVETLKTMQREGKVVLDNRFDGTTLVITVLQDETEPPQSEMAPPASRPNAYPAQRLSPSQVTPQVRQRDFSEDVKPRIRSASSEVEFVAPASRPGRAIPLPTFPRTIQPSNAPNELRASCAVFIEEFFRRHEHSRSGLQDFYTPTAMFSCRTAPGSGVNVEQLLNPTYSRIVEKIYITPTPITHALRRIPALSCDSSTFTFDAIELDGLTVRNSTPILLVVHGSFEEFPSHDRVSFSRSFVLVSKVATNSFGCPADYVIQSDHVVFRPYEPDRPLPLSTATAANKRMAATEEQSGRPTKRAARDDNAVSAPNPPGPLFFPPPTPSPAPESRGPFSRPRVQQQRDEEQSTGSTTPRRTVPAPAVRDRSRSPGAASDSDDEPADQEAMSRRQKRQATVAAELNASSVSREELDKVVAETVRRELAAILAKQTSATSAAATPTAPTAAERAARSIDDAPAPSSSNRQSAAVVPPPPVVRPRTPPEVEIVEQGPSSSAEVEDDQEAGSSTARRWPVRIGETQAIETRLSGVSNKLRYLCRRGKSGFYALTSGGDVLDWSGTTKKPVVTVHKGAADDKVDDFAFARETLIVGYLGSKVPGQRELAQPKAQIRLFSQQSNELVVQSLQPKPHLTGGVTSLTPVPGNRLKWVTAGQDKTLYLWTQSTTTREVRTVNIATTHTNVVTSLAYLEGRGHLASAGDDKRVLLYDLSAQQPIWKGMLDSRVLHVSHVPYDRNLILYRTAAPTRQFALYDARRACAAGPVSSFGFALPARPGSAAASSSTSGSGAGSSGEVSFGRYFRGDWIDSIFAHPDAGTGIKLWDVRRIESDASKVSSTANMPPMASLACGRSKVLQVLFDGRPSAGGDRIILGEQSYFTACKLI